MSSVYYLMNKNERLIEFSVENGVLGEDIREIQSFSSVRPIGFTNVESWIQNRNYAKHKSHMKKWISTWGIDNTIGFLDITHALGINDCLWVKSKDSCLDWEHVNLYHNAFSDVAQKTAFDSGLFGLQLSPTDIVSPEFTSEGSCPKCWVIEDGKIVLYKAGLSGASNLGKEPYSEYLSSAIVKQSFDNSIDYDLEIYNGKLCSKCELFTNENEGFVPFSKYLDANQGYTIKRILDLCTEMGYEKECRDMFLIDSIIFNQDRHVGNFGFIVDNDTFQIKRFAPLFDYNISMLGHATDDDLSNYLQYEETYLVGHKLGGRFSDIGAAILTKEQKDRVKPVIDFPKHHKYNLDEDRITKIINVMNSNLKKIFNDGITQVKTIDK